MEFLPYEKFLKTWQPLKLCMDLQAYAGALSGKSINPWLLHHEIPFGMTASTFPTHMMGICFFYTMSNGRINFG